MTKYLDNKTILFAASFLAILLDFQGYKIGSHIFGTLFLGWLAFRVYNNVLYRLGKLPNEIRFSTKNDSFQKTSSLFFGVLLMVGPAIWIYKVNSTDFASFAAIFFGFLLLANGLFFLPKGKLQIKNSKILIPSIKEEIELSQIKLISIKKEKLQFITLEDQATKLNQLELDKEQQTQIFDFLSEKLNGYEIELKIENKL